MVIVSPGKAAPLSPEPHNLNTSLRNLAWRRIISLIFLLLLIISSPLQAAEPTHLKVGVYSYEPLIFFDDHQGAQGLWVEMLEHLAKLEGWTLEFIPGTWDECFHRLQKGEIDLLPNIAYTKERAKLFDFSDEFLFLDWGVTYTPKGKTLDSIFDLEGKRVSALRGSIYLEGFRTLLDQFAIHAEIIEVDEFIDVFAAMEQGESDAGISAQVHAQRIEGDFAIDKTHIFFSPVKIRIAAPKGATPQLVSILDKHFKRLKENKSSYYHQRVDYWMNQYSSGSRELPAWLTSLILLSLTAALILAGFVIILRRSVKAKTNSLQQSEQRFRSLFKLIPIPLCLVKQDGTVSYINDRFIQMFGYTLKDIPILDDWWPRAYPDKEYRSWVTRTWHLAVTRARKQGRDIEPIEYQITCNNGRVRDVEISGITLDEDFLATFIDNTERNRLQEEQLQIEQKMLHTQKLESLGVLAGGIAHDFNNILMAVMGNTELAQRRLPEESPALKYLQQVKQAASKAANLANQMLAYSGKGNFLIVPLDLTRTVVEMQQMLQVSISKKVQLIYHLSEKTPSIEADATQIQQIIMNLVINASEAIDEKDGIVDITTGVTACNVSYLKDCWHADELPTGNYVYIEVSDNGAGMDQTTLDNIFEPFFTTKFTGRGLGLAAVQGIVRGHRGTINISSKPENGSTFRILFPASSLPVAALSPQTTISNKKESGLVLLVDDEEAIRKTVQAMLEELGYKVLTASDGVEALAEYRRFKGQIDFVLMDLTMPKLNGDGAAQQLRQIDPEIRIILASGYSQQECVLNFTAKGISACLQKPYQLKALQQAIDTLSNDRKISSALAD